MRLQELPSPSNVDPRDADFGIDAVENHEDSGVDILQAMLRYKWAVIIPTLVGFCVGLAIYTQLPEVYRASARLLVESDQPMILDSTTGDMVVGVPGAGLIESQMFSDEVLSATEANPLMEPFLPMIRQEHGSFRAMASDVIVFEPETDDKASNASLAFLLAIEHTDAEFCEAAIQSLNSALQNYFADKREDSLGELRSLIVMAQEKLHPQMMALEEKYREFQSKARLQWDQQGLAFNPHRDEQLRLMARKAELMEEQREVETELGIIEATVAQSDDPVTAIEIISQLLNKKLVLPVQSRRPVSLAEEDVDLALLTVEETLVPMMVERERMSAEYAPNHPAVKQLDSQIEATREKLKELSRLQAERIGSLLDSSDREKAQAEEAKIQVVAAQRARNEMLKQQIAMLQVQIDEQRAEAEKLAQDEQMNLSLNRELERVQGLYAQLSEQMAKVELTDKQAGIELTELMAPKQAVVVGPNLLLWLVGGSGLGLLFGCGLSYLLEGHAGTFRSADEIASTLRLPILSHVPFDPGRRRKLKKGEVDPYASLDEKLSVVHRPTSVSAEAVRAVRTAVFFEAAATEAKLFQVTSPLPSDGKTTMAGNLAVSMAQAGKRVLMIDCDLRRPQLSDNFSLNADRGLTDILNGDCDPDSAIHATPIKNLWVIPSGPIPLNPAEALTLPEMGELLQWVRDRYDYVIVDTPPLLVVTDPSIVAGLVDGVIVTVKVRRKSKANAKEAVGILRGIGAKIVGVIINASDDAASSDGYRGYGQYKYSRYAAKYNSGGAYGDDRKAYARRSGGRPTLVVGRRHELAEPDDGRAASKQSQNGAVGLLEHNDDPDA